MAENARARWGLPRRGRVDGEAARAVVRALTAARARAAQEAQAAGEAEEAHLEHQVRLFSGWNGASQPAGPFVGLKEVLGRRESAYSRFRNKREG
eukprot:9335892-Pyramimonas_sp.AAC.1